MKRSLSFLQRIILTLVYYLIWLLILILTLGTVNRVDLLERGQGWLVNLTQSEYQTATRDTSTQAEMNAAGAGAPVLCVLDFGVL